MRVGENPNKNQSTINDHFYHQVVIPVYIPCLEGYFEESFEIFKICMQSLFLTTHSKTFYTIVNNGSCKEVVDYINWLYKEKKIHGVIHTANIGKLNAILKGISGEKFSLITITDADVLFLKNWQKKTYEIFEAFPKAGVVSPSPNNKLIKYFTSNIFLENFFSKKLRFRNTLNTEAMNLFAKSIGNPKLFNKEQLENSLTVKNNNTIAVVGSGHYVATYRGSVFADFKDKYSNFTLGGDSEINLLDKPVVNKGLWRLSTYDNYSFHMGNVVEDWMYEAIKMDENSDLEELKSPRLKKVKENAIINYFKNDVFSRIIFIKLIWKCFIIHKGLSFKLAEKIVEK